MEKNRKGKVIIFIIVVLAFSGLLGYDIYIHLRPTSKTEITNINKQEKEVTITDQGIAESVDKLYDATVIINLQTNGQTTGWGSGFVYKVDDNNGYVVTNYHVTEGYKKALVEFTNGSTTEGTVVGGDQYTDVSVIKVDKNSIIKVAEIGKSADTRLGDTVFTIGTPVSLNYKFTVTRGILSGKDRLSVMSSSSNSMFYNTSDSWYLNELQIDASINSGNSGGPLANANGEVIGIVNSKLSRSATTTSSIENLGFAIPIEDVSNIADQVINNGEVKRPYVGVTMTTIAGAERNDISISGDVKSGAVVVSTEEGSAAQQAGLKSGDVIIKLNDYDIPDYKYLKYYINRYKIGDKVTITYIRDGKTNTTQLEIKAK